MAIVDLGKEMFEKVRVIGNTYYEDLNGDMQLAIAVAPRMEKDKETGGLKDVAKHNHLVVGKDLTIKIARKLVQAHKGAPVYAEGKKPKEV